MGDEKKLSKKKNIVLCIVSLVILCVLLFPIYWIVVTSLKTEQEIFQILTVPAPDLKPAAQPYHFRDRGVQHRNCLPHLPVNPFLPGTQGRKPLHHPKGVGVPGAKLAYRRYASGFLLLPFQKIAPFKQIFP